MRLVDRPNVRSDLAALVPPFVRAWVADDPDVAHRTVVGTVLVASAPDGSPAPLSTTALEIACARGADVLKSVGDRLVLLFADDDQERRGEATAADLTTRFGVTAGVDRGAVDTFLVGCSHRELFIAGDTVSRALRRTGTTKRSRMTIAHVPREQPTWPTELNPAPYIPEAIRRRASFSPHTRDMATAILHLANLDALIVDAGADAATRHLRDLVSYVQHSFAEHDIAFLSSDVAVGGPAIRCASVDARSVLRALDAISDYPSPIELRIAFSYGPLACGAAGSDNAVTFVAIGEAVSEAAHLIGYVGANEMLATTGAIARTGFTPHTEMTHIGSQVVYRIRKPRQRQRGIINMLLNLGTLSFENDDLASARQYFEDALALSRQSDFQSDEAMLLLQLGRVALAMGDAERAMVRCDESLVIRRDLDDDIGVAEALTLLGRARYADGDPAMARRCWLRAVDIIRGLTEPAEPPSSV